jgi:hypothetical protein
MTDDDCAYCSSVSEDCGDLCCLRSGLEPIDNIEYCPMIGVEDEFFDEDECFT